MAFTDREKARIKHFLSYPDWVNLAQAILLGFPAGSQPLFLLESAFNRLTEGGEESARQDLCECEDIENQMREARGRLRAIQIGNLKMNPKELTILKRELMYWTTRLADELGVIPDPYSQAFHNAITQAGGRNARVANS